MKINNNNKNKAELKNELKKQNKKQCTPSILKRNSKKTHTYIYEINVNHFKKTN